jgi:hypothetical protein
MITIDTADEVLSNKANYIRREVLLLLDRPFRQLEAHEGFLASSWTAQSLLGDLRWWCKR